ncbi:hypothetical protein RHGRI_017532 [Rhododendron griersonianum]|uniref:Uncharacterized protein n=1 Tax=Rhododendron griersonianum TaxID=479676 RepID=A0AAV6JY72_9ERIC|nr:hypothetical protein RHGRI_017532 [Rhododendron griersonianum]KAG5545097.1 hypothetical protein RHGRI_017532 [Rhododendron griersonianum]
MEDKQLNLNRPLISVRRFSPVVGSEKDVQTKNKRSIPSVPLPPFYKSELKSGPVSNPGTIPFTWEKSPGRPKEERKPQTLDHPPIIPKLPPGRIPEVKRQENSSVGRREAGKTSSSTLSVPSIEENVTNFEGSDSGDGDEAYLDALDTLSRTESYFLSCTVSCLSGLDGPEVAPSGTFSTDAQTMDFMMGRFLPAAKAMTSEMPQHGTWKQPVLVKEQPRQSRELVSGNKRPPLNRSRPNDVPPYCPHEFEEEESADEDDEDDEPGNLSTKVCGLLPRFCVKSSLCVLNPVPVMSVRTRVPMSSVKRTQAGSSSAGFCQQTKNERMRVAIHEQRSIAGPQKTEMRKKLEGSSLYRRLQGSGASPWQNELPKSRFYEEGGFPDIPEEAQIDGINGFRSQKRSPDPLRELLADHSPEKGIDSASPMVEKTAYVDSVHKAVSLEETPSVDAILTNIEKSNIPREDQDLCGESIASADVKLPRKGYLDYEDHQQQQFKKVENIENYQEIKSHCPAPPPPPKSPSESWLWRTLPSISTRNPPSLSFLATKVNYPLHASKTPSVDPKWETVVKTKKDLITAAPKS